MKRIFEVNGEYFANKTDAKTARGAPVKPADGKTPAQYKSEIHKGPDHIFFGRTDLTPNRNAGRKSRRHLSADITG